KDRVENKWQEEAKVAPLQKAEGHAESLKETNDRLGDIQYTINNQTLKLSQLLKSGTTINKKNLGDIREAFSQKMDAAKTQREAGQAMLADAVRRKNLGAADTARKMMLSGQATERNVNDALKKIDKLDDELG